MGDHPLPDEIIKRFDGKIMAITGYEQDQVLVDPVGQPGVNPSEDLSVPINWAYNHHYMVAIRLELTQPQACRRACLPPAREFDSHHYRHG